MSGPSAEHRTGQSAEDGSRRGGGKGGGRGRGKGGGGLSIWGGILTGALLWLPSQRPDLAWTLWVAVVPLLASLARHRDQPALRALQGASCGAFWLLLVSLRPLVAVGGEGTPGLDPLDTTLRGVGLAASLALFGAASGPLLRSRSFLALMGGVPLLWVGIEVLSGPFSPFHDSVLNNLLCLGTLFPASGKEARAAQWLGPYGLSLAVMLCGMLLLEVLRRRRLTAQLLLASLAVALPLLGLLMPASPAPPRQSLVGIVTGVDTVSDALLLSTDMVAQQPDVIVWPGLEESLATLDADVPHLMDPRVRELARRANATIVLGGLCEAKHGQGSSADRSDLADSEEQRPQIDPARSVGSRLLHVRLAVPPTGPITAIFEEPVNEAEAGPFPRDLRWRFLSLVKTRAGTVAIGGGASFDEPTPSRKAVDLGASLLVAIELAGEELSGRSAVPCRAVRAYRAIESGRWLLDLGGKRTLLADPERKGTLDIPDVRAARVEALSLREDLTLYVRWTWLLEPAALAAAGWIVLWGLMGRLTRKGRPSALLVSGSGSDSSSSPGNSP